MLPKIPVLLVALAGVSCGVPTVTEPTAGPQVASGVQEALAASPTVRVIVSLKEPEASATALAARAEQVAAAQGGVLAGLTPREFRLSRQYEFTPALAGEVTQDGLSKLQSLPGVLHVGLDRARKAFLSESTALIGARDVHAAGYRGNGAYVAVLDSGIDRSHPDLRNRVSLEYCSCSYGGASCCPNGSSTQSGDGSAYDDDGHGTHVAGIIASQGIVAPVGVAPGAALVAVKVLGPSGGSDSGILAGLEFVLRYKIQVVNMSLGGGRFAGYCDAESPAAASIFRSLVSRGTAVVVASGNEAFKDSIGAPACFSQVWSVGAVYDAASAEADGSCGDATAGADRVTCFSNSYALLDFLAPGASITSSVPGGGTATWPGTSMAAPHVAGAAALVMGASPSITPTEVYSRLRGTGRPVTDSRNGVTTPRIDLAALLRSLQ